MNTLAASATAACLAARGMVSHQMRLAAAVHGYTAATRLCCGVLLPRAIAVLSLVRTGPTNPAGRR